MAGDGNCCFYSVALTNADRIRAHTPDFFQTHNLYPEQGVSGLAHRLRHVVVNEWQANPQDYEGFVGYGVDVLVEAEKVKQDGIVLGELGNTVLLSLSNATTNCTVVRSEPPCD